MSQSALKRLKKGLLSWNECIYYKYLQCFQAYNDIYSPLFQSIPSSHTPVQGIHPYTLPYLGLSDLITEAQFPGGLARTLSPL